MESTNNNMHHPEPAPEMQDLDFFIGTFEGTGATSPTSENIGYSIERKVTGRTDLSGFWLFMRFEDRGTDENPKPIQGNWQLGYDSNHKQFIGIWTDNLGRWFEQTSTGWNSNRIVFTGGYSVNNEEIIVRDTFEKIAEQTIQLTVDVKKGKNDWLTFLRIDLQKVSAV